MATFDELRGLFNETDTLRNRLEVAIVITAEQALQNPDTFPTASADATLQASRRSLAVSWINRTNFWAGIVMKLALSENRNVTPAQIVGASEGALTGVCETFFDALAITRERERTDGTFGA